MIIETEQVRFVLGEYLFGMTHRDISRIENIFIPPAQMYFIREGKFIQSPVFNGLIDYIKATPKDENATANILSVDVSGNAACGKVEVISGGLIYTDFFALLKIGEDWKIVNKTFAVTKT